MPDLQKFRENVTRYRKRKANSEGRPYTQAELAQVIGLSPDELGHRLRGTGRSSLTKENILAVVLALAEWDTLTWEEAVELLTYMDYPLNPSHWKTELQRFLSPPDTSGTPANILRERTASLPDSDVLSEKRSLYLQHMIQTHQWLMLPSGREVPLERIYISLRADEMHAKERQAEHALYLEEVASLLQDARSELPDPYIEFAVLRKVIARHPKMLMLDVRNWPRLFGEREQYSLSLAEVVKHHLQVVILGDPGSGKTTLLKWLVLQFAKTLKQQQYRVVVSADMVQPSAEVRTAVDLGSARLPVFLQIADYARLRWPPGQKDRELTIEECLRSALHLDRLPEDLSREAAGKLIGEAIQTGQALVVLDGLDEISDPQRRRKVMEAVRRFLEVFSSQDPNGTTRRANQIILTSRIVGYQFDPLAWLPHYTLEEMDEAAITAFCHAWMRHVIEPGDAQVKELDQRANQLKSALFSHSHPGVRSMAGNPLLLTILAQVGTRQGVTHGVPVLPVSRVALFDEAMRAFYDQREAYWDRIGITSLKLTRAFGAVAVALHANETAGFATEGEVRKQLGRVLSDEDQVEAVLVAARDVSGFLVTRGEGIYGFLHRSVQEYFAAWHLANQREQLIEGIVDHAFDPIWREPVVLAVGLLSRPRHPEHEQLKALFAALLAAPDPTSEVLPRQTLLVATACLECERVPENIVQRSVTTLLSVAAQYVRKGAFHAGYARAYGLRSSFVTKYVRKEAFHALRTRIEQILEALQRSQEHVRREAETALCHAILAESLEHRYAAIALVTETQWDSPRVAKILVRAWQTYAGPAASLRIAIDSMSIRHPDYFQPGFLPFKQSMATFSDVWEKVMNDQKWKVLIGALYLPKNANWESNLINRDSSLTPLILAALQQQPESDPLSTLRPSLFPLASQPGTAISRDAALALAALGDDTWVEACVANADGQEHRLYSIFASLDLERAQAEGIHAFTAFDDTLARDIGLTLAYVLLFLIAKAHELPHAQALTHRLLFTMRHFSPHRGGISFLNEDRSHAIAHAQAFDLGFVFDLNFIIELIGVLESRYADSDVFSLRIFRSLDRALASALIRPLDHTNIDELETLLEVAQAKWVHNEEITQNLDLVHRYILHRYKVVSHSSVDQTWEVLLASYQNHCAVLLDLSTLDDYDQVTVDTLPQLLIDLTHPEDTRRERARSLLGLEHTASTFGRSTVEQLATLARKHRDQHQINAYLIDALHNIIYDVPSWITAWSTEVMLTENMCLSEVILGNIRKVTVDAFKAIMNALPKSALSLKVSLLESLNWLARLKRIPKESLTNAREQLFVWLDHETDHQIRGAIIHVLGHWYDNPNEVGTRLLTILNGSTHNSNRPMLYEALARLVGPEPIIDKTKSAPDAPELYEPLIIGLVTTTPTIVPPIVTSVRTSLYNDCSHPAAAAALARLTAVETRNAISGSNTRYYEQDSYLIPFSFEEALDQVIYSKLNELGKLLPDITQLFNALLDAVADDDIWDRTYHDVLIKMASVCLEYYPDLLTIVWNRLKSSLIERWPVRRISLAMTAAAAEIMPAALRDISHGELEEILVKGCKDAESADSRRFAFTALGYLFTLTSQILPVLLAGCQDVESVQHAAIKAAGCFQTIEDKHFPLSSLTERLTDESASTAYAVAHLLEALGTSAAGTSTGFHERIIAALIQALKDPSSKRSIVIAGQDKGILEDALFDVLLRVAGWIG